MSRRFIITESEKNDIRRMYGLITEQSGQPLVSPKVYEIIKQIESIYSYMDNGKVVGRKFNGNEIENELSNYIDKTIGKSSWFKMDDKLRAQIYAYAFQSDSGKGGELKMKWIAGLANALDSGVNRGNIVRKPLNDPNVQDAIKKIQTACQNGTINSIYSRYLQILDEQYKSSDYNDNYRNIWKNRPQAIDRMMNGEDSAVIFDEWEQSLN